MPSDDRVILQALRSNFSCRIRETTTFLFPQFLNFQNNTQLLLHVYRIRLPLPVRNLIIKLPYPLILNSIPNLTLFQPTVPFLPDSANHNHLFHISIHPLCLHYRTLSLPYHLYHTPSFITVPIPPSTHLRIFSRLHARLTRHHVVLVQEFGLQGR